MLKRRAAGSGIAVPSMAPAGVEELAQLSLKGNVRELENLLHRAIALNDGGELHVARPSRPMELAETPAQTPAAVPGQAEGAIPNDLQHHLDQQEREILVKVLQETGFNRTAAAARLGLSLRQIRYRIARLNIDTPGDTA